MSLGATTGGLFFLADEFTPSMSVLKASPTSPGGGTLQPEAADFACGQHRLLGFADSPLEGQGFELSVPAVEQLALFGTLEHRRLAGLHHMLWPAYGRRRKLLGSTWPVISQWNSIRTAASCCFTPAPNAPALQALYVCRDIERPDHRELAHARA